MTNRRDQDEAGDDELDAGACILVLRMPRVRRWAFVGRFLGSWGAMVTVVS